MSCSNISTHVDNAIEEVRHALIHALENKTESRVKKLFDVIAVLDEVKRDLGSNISEGDPKEFWADATDYYATDTSNYRFDLNSDYLYSDRVGGDLDALDDVITFGAAQPVDPPTSLGEDVIDFGDYKSREDS